MSRVWTREPGLLPPQLPVPSVDLVRLPDGSFLLTGPETVARRGMLPMPLSGFHLRPGACRALFGIAADEVPVDGVPVSSPRSAELEPDAVVARAIAAIRATPGVAITELAGLVGLSERQLRRRFAVEVGLRPKEYARVVRLHRAVASRGRWADIAVRCGCYDQAHLLAEFRKAGCSPADVRFLQAAGKASGSGSTHDLRMARADGARRTA